MVTSAIFRMHLQHKDCANSHDIPIMTVYVNESTYYRECADKRYHNDSHTGRVDTKL